MSASQLHNQPVETISPLSHQSHTIVLVIEGTYPWYRGGVSEWVYRYLLAFPDYQFRIVQIATDEWNQADLSTALYNIPEQVKCFERTHPPVLPGAEWEQRFGEWFDQHEHLIEVCRGADWIHVSNTGFAGWLGKTLAQKTDIPLFLTEHALYWQEVDLGTVALECGYPIPQEEHLREVVAESFRTIARQVYQAAAHTVSVSACNIPAQKQLGAASPQYIPNGVDASWLNERTHQNPDELTIGWIGRCAAIKDPLRFFDLVDAFRSIEDRGSVDFMMMLSDAAEHDLAQAVKERAENYGEVTTVWNASAIDHIDTMDAICITSLNESQPLILFEALARQVLPVGWTVGDATERYGFLQPQTTSAMDLAHLILARWRDQDDWQQQVVQRYEMVKQTHTWETIFQRYRGLYETRK